MGMYDVYVPSPPLACRRCKRPLGEFQGKDGPCALLIWVQGSAAPVDQECDDRWKLPAEELAVLRLPQRFELYTSCTGCENHADVTGFCENEVWKLCVFGCHAGATPIPAVRVADRWRQCTRCTDAWEEEPGIELSGCPSCGALTIITEGWDQR